MDGDELSRRAPSQPRVAIQKARAQWRDRFKQDCRQRIRQSREERIMANRTMPSSPGSSVQMGSMTPVPSSPGGPAPSLQRVLYEQELDRRVFLETRAAYLQNLHASERAELLDDDRLAELALEVLEEMSPSRPSRHFAPAAGPSGVSAVAPPGFAAAADPDYSAYYGDVPDIDEIDDCLAQFEAEGYHR